ncbi:hypothetical protein MYAM1_002305 [Malassezia yamatoensis]|uniref:rRNA-processing protein n=1 Tax=Malassezia yamatoensis TaxID=253288 RepID=A0AAJ5YUA2_9BASI|nr:hypothetical protein MYAM1_002305 [Malassezia yamatoensis]
MTTDVLSGKERSSSQSRPRNESVNIAGKVKGNTWKIRQQQRLRQQAVKQREREMAQEKEHEADRKREIRKERERKAEEKARLQAMAEKVCIVAEAHVSNH